MNSLSIQQLPAAKARQVLRLTMALPGQSSSEIEAQVSNFINHSRALSHDLGLQWLAFEESRLVAACSCIESPGRTGVVFIPAYGMPGGKEEALCSLLGYILSDMQRRKVRLAQCLLNPDDQYNELALKQAGFHPIAELIYMDCPILHGDIPDRFADEMSTENPSKLTWDEYNSASHRDFSELILASYCESLDCPGLAGLRDIEDILAGHKSVGLFRAHRWRLARLGGHAAGCILLAENPLRRVLEVAYMGVHHGHRRRGLGQILIHEAQSIAYRERFEKVTLAVDAANAPARHLYGSTGFIESFRRRAWIRPLSSSTESS